VHRFRLLRAGCLSPFLYLSPYLCWGTLWLTVERVKFSQIGCREVRKALQSAGRQRMMDSAVVGGNTHIRV
jgi:hypothetical protein